LNWFLHIFELFVRMGWLIMTPILITLCGKALGLSLGNAVSAGVRTTGAVFGLNLMANSLGSNLTSVIADITLNYQLALEITDAGWAASSAIAYASAISSWIIPLHLLVNWVMLLSRCTRTLNLDLWNLWHVAFLGAMVERLTDSLAYGMVTAGAMSVLILIFSDRCGWRMARYCQIPGISVTSGYATAAVPFGLVAEHLFNLIPGRPRLVLAKGTEPRAALASPVAWSFSLGILLGVLAGREGIAILQLAMTFGALAFLAPHLGQAFAGAITPVGERMVSFSREKLGIKGNLYLGMTPTTTLGNGTMVVVTLMVAPLITFLAGNIPGNRFLVQGDIVMLPYIIGVIVIVCRGDLMRSLLAGLLASSTILWCASSLAELFTLGAVTANAEAFEQLGTISNFSDGGNFLCWLSVQAGSYGFAGMALMVVVVVTLAVWNRNRIVTGADVAGLRPKRVRRAEDAPAPEPAPAAEPQEDAGAQQ
jgi:PTS system galactitol-specific IIC component